MLLSLAEGGSDRRSRKADIACRLKENRVRIAGSLGEDGKKAGLPQWSPQAGGIGCR